jgi:HAD superfamily hydrolase (TIGR01509 family)
MQAVIFDCDGVLVDSEPIYAKAFASALSSYGCPLPADFLQRELHGKCLTDCYQWLARHWQFTVTEAFEQTLFKRTDELIPLHLKAITEVSLVVEALACSVAVASNGMRQSVVSNLEFCGLRHYFGENIYTAEEVPRAKPAPDLYLHAAACLGLTPDRCAVIEDSPLGVRAALDAGMAVCWFTSGTKALNPSLIHGAHSADSMTGVSEWLRTLGLLA